MALDVTVQLDSDLLDVGVSRLDWGGEEYRSAEGGDVLSAIIVAGGRGGPFHSTSHSGVTTLSIFFTRFLLFCNGIEAF